MVLLNHKLHINGYVGLSGLKRMSQQAGPNTILLGGTTNQDLFMMFRRGGGSPPGWSGVVFSDFSASHFFMYNQNNALNIGYSTQNVSATYNPDVDSSSNLLSLSTNGKLYLENIAHFNETVGIGTGAPTAKLHVIGDTSSVTSLAESATKAKVRFENHSSSSLSLFQGVNDKANWYQQVSNGAGTASQYDLLLNPYGGNVGIGTDDPNKLLHVNGEMRVKGMIYAADHNSGVGFKDDGGNLGIWVEDGGYVGIGKANPDEKLDIEGGNVRVDGNYIYSNEKTYYKVYKYWDFKPENHDHWWAKTTGGTKKGWLRKGNTSTEEAVNAFCTIDLPHDAIIKEVVVDWYDNDNSYTQYLKLYKGNAVSETLIGEDDTYDSGTQQQGLIQNLNSTIDNVTPNIYFLKLESRTEKSTLNLAWVRVKYTVTKAD